MIKAFHNIETQQKKPKGDLIHGLFYHGGGVSLLGLALEG